jgi:hypothetical protein
MYIIRRFGLLSVLKFGFILGVFITCFPSMLGAAAMVAVIGALRQFLESLATSPFLAAADLKNTLQLVRAWDNSRWLVFVGVTLFTTFMGGILEALGAVLTAALYNLIARISGGLMIELEGPSAPLVPSPALPQAQPVPSAASRCPRCGSAVRAGAQFCQQCGARI